MNFLNFIYPRKVSLFRPALGAQIRYEELDYEPLSIQGVKASIQFKGNTGRPNTGLPGDVSNETYWAVFIPFNPPGQTIGDGGIMERDKVIDDFGRSFEVVAPYWNSLGYNLRCKLLSP